jgi:hypothetical protein
MGEVLTVLERSRPIIFGALPRLSVYAPQRPIKVLNHPIERQAKRGAPSDHYIVMPRLHSYRFRPPHNFPQPAAYAISLDGVADFSRNRETNSHGPAVTSFANLQHERGRGCLSAGRGG